MSWTYTDVTGLTYQTLLSVVQAEIICAINERREALGFDPHEFWCGDGTAKCTYPVAADFDGFPILGEVNHASTLLMQNMTEMITYSAVTGILPGAQSEDPPANYASYKYTTESEGDTQLPQSIPGDRKTFSNPAFWNAIITHLKAMKYVKVQTNYQTSGTLDGETKGTYEFSGLPSGAGWDTFKQAGWDNRGYEAGAFAGAYTPDGCYWGFWDEYYESPTNKTIYYGGVSALKTWPVNEPIMVGGEVLSETLTVSKLSEVLFGKFDADCPSITFSIGSATFNSVAFSDSPVTTAEEEITDADIGELLKTGTDIELAIDTAEPEVHPWGSDDNLESMVIQADWDGEATVYYDISGALDYT